MIKLLLLKEMMKVRPYHDWYFRHANCFIVKQEGQNKVAFVA